MHVAHADFPDAALEVRFDCILARGEGPGRTCANRHNRHQPGDHYWPARQKCSVVYGRCTGRNIDSKTDHRPTPPPERLYRPATFAEWYAELGASRPRGTIALDRCARARALGCRRRFCQPGQLLCRAIVRMDDYATADASALKPRLPGIGCEQGYQPVGPNPVAVV